MLLPHGLCLLAAAWLLLLTPTLNADDLQIAEWAAAALPAGWGTALTTVLFNQDLGATQLRTYGLARAIQYIQAGLFGAAPVPGYAFMILLHVSSGALVYKLARKCGGDSLTGIFAAVTWVASPAALPLLKVQHHFLYLIVPYYPLLGWVLLSVTRQQSARIFMAGSLLLTVAWMLGEGVIVPIFLAVLSVAFLSGSWRRVLSLTGQGAVAGLLLALYLGFQLVFVQDPSLPQRFSLAPSTGMVEPFLRQLWENGRAIIGLSHLDAELQTMLGGLDVFASPIFWIGMAVLTVCGIAAACFTPRSQADHDRRISLVLALICISSLGVYLLFSVAGMGVFATRYAAAFFALLPVAVIMAMIAHAPPRAAQLTSSVLTALTISLSLTLLYRAEVLVSEPNRQLLKSLQGRVVVLRPDTQFDLNPAVFGATSGLRPISSNGLADPMRFLWTSELALRAYANAPLGNTCRMVSDGNAEVFILQQSRGIYPLQRYAVVGSSLTPAQACSRTDNQGVPK